MPALLLGPRPASRIAVVGARGGIGRAVVAALRDHGARPVELDMPASLASSGGDLGVGSAPAAIPIDVQDGASVADAFAAVARSGPLHGLVNLAGYAPERRPVGATDPAVWDDVVAVNLGGAFRVAHAALPLLRAAATEEAPAAIVHVSSGLATRLMPGYGPYGAAKAGLIALTKSIAVENAPLVRANAVAPGAVDTPFLQGGTGRTGAHGGGGERSGNGQGEAPPGARLDVSSYIRAVPMGRIATPDDVAGPVLFLLSPAAGFMTGQVLWVNGGALTP